MNTYIFVSSSSPFHMRPIVVTISDKVVVRYQSFNGVSYNVDVDWFCLYTKSENTEKVKKSINTCINIRYEFMVSKYYGILKDNLFKIFSFFEKWKDIRTILLKQMFHAALRHSTSWHLHKHAHSSSQRSHKGFHKSRLFNSPRPSL